MKQPHSESGRIFGPAQPLSRVVAQAEERRKNQSDPMAKHYVGAEFYQEKYAAAKARLTEPDMLSVNDAAAKLFVSPEEFIEMANRGAALLIEVEGVKAAPAWQFGKDGRIDDLKLDIAREFALEGASYFRFMDYIAFMTSKNVDISATLPAGKLRDMFKKAGLQNYSCSLAVQASPDQLADERFANRDFFALLVSHLDAAITRGGWDPSGGLSRAFRDKYGLPGLTLEEDRAEAIKKTRKPEKPPKP